MSYRQQHADPWGWLKVAVIVRRYGYLRIGWNYSLNRRRKAARRACLRGLIRRVRGKPGADHFEPVPACLPREALRFCEGGAT